MLYPPLHFIHRSAIDEFALIWSDAPFVGCGNSDNTGLCQTLGCQLIVWDYPGIS